jgi:arabinan endo-1,5-alpha-L-arabinosidase
VRNTSVGSIDATFMKVGNDNYLVWKDDSNGLTPQKPTWIWAAQLGHGGINIIGHKVPLIVNDLPWEGPLVEAPWIIQNGKYYYLFYSGNGYCGAAYAVGVARSTNPLGPYEKKGDPIRKSDSKFIGPGHCSVLKTP